MIAYLRKAAQLADECSIYRDKRIELTMLPEGVLVNGHYPGWHIKEPVAWETLATDPGVLEMTIRDVDRQLNEFWRNDGMPKRVVRES